jgi:hypothetical protein
MTNFIMARGFAGRRLMPNNGKAIRMKSFYHKPTLTRGAFAALVFLFVISMAKGYAMSLLKNPEEEIVLSSPFDGVITLHNKPVEGAKVVRLLTWFETQTNSSP